MKFPQVVSALIEAQNNQDSKAYSEAFSETATVQDEGKTHLGRQQIETWIRKANEAYNSVVKPVGYTGNDQSGTLSAETSGSFPGSPIILHYQFRFENGLISFLSIGD